MLKKALDHMSNKLIYLKQLINTLNINNVNTHLLYIVTWLKLLLTIYFFTKLIVNLNIKAPLHISNSYFA